jgi:hypothetical protein
LADEYLGREYFVHLRPSPAYDLSENLRTRSER